MVEEVPILRPNVTDVLGMGKRRKRKTEEKMSCLFH